MMHRIPVQVTNMVMEASSAEDRKYMRNMDKNDIHQINGQSVQNLYELTMQRANIDFGAIPDSAGDIEKCKYYESTKQCLDVLTELFKQNNITEPIIDDVKRAISNMLKFRPQFTMGFRQKHEYVMLTYNSLVMAIVDTTTMLISSYTNFITTASAGYQLNVLSDKKRGMVTTDTLKMFNQASDNGTMNQSLQYMLEAGRKALIGEEVVITGIIILGLLSIVPIMRELIYFYYHSRVKIADYLKVQADFLEMNKLAVQASAKAPQERKQIIKKQEKVISDLRKASDKIMIDHVDTNDVVKKEVKKESSMFSLPSIDKQLSNNKLMNNDLRIL